MSILGPRELVVLLVCLIPVLHIFRRRSALPLPPGPPRLPLIGNVLSIPKDYTHRYYKRLSDQLGAWYIARLENITNE